MKKRKKKSRTPPKMKKRKRKPGRPPKIKRREPPSPSFGPELVPLDPEEFKRVFALAMKAAAKERPATTPPRVKITEEDGSGAEYQVTDTPLGRTMGPVLAYYNDRGPQAISATVRVTELMKLARSKDLAPWVRSSPGRPEFQLHPALIEAAATTRLTKDTKFPLPEFLREVHRIAREKYPEGDAW